MRVLPLLVTLAAPILALDKPLNIEVTSPASCSHKSAKGDKIDVHYRGTLTNGNEFDSSYSRGQPLSFTLGRGAVIKGWDEGLLGMCPGEKRVLTIQPEWAYGERAMADKIPANSVLVFETEMVRVNGKGVEEGKQEL